MRKLLVSVILCLCVSALSAQKWGIKGGPNVSSTSFSVVGHNLDMDNLAGFQLGTVFEAPVSGALFYNVGLQFSLKGTKYRGANLSFYNLEFPVNLGYKFDIGKAKLLALAGPYYATALYCQDDGNKQELGSGDEEFKRSDFGLNVGAGVEVGSFQFIAGYGFGLTNLANLELLEMKHRVASLTVTYFFGK